jgi:hypothetical protein
MLLCDCWLGVQQKEVLCVVSSQHNDGICSRLRDGVFRLEPLGIPVNVQKFYRYEQFSIDCGLGICIFLLTLGTLAGVSVVGVALRGTHFSFENWGWLGSVLYLLYSVALLGRVLIHNFQELATCSLLSRVFVGVFRNMKSKYGFCQCKRKAEVIRDTLRSEGATFAWSTMEDRSWSMVGAVL